MMCHNESTCQHNVGTLPSRERESARARALLEGNGTGGGDIDGDMDFLYIVLVGPACMCFDLRACQRHAKVLRDNCVLLQQRVDGVVELHWIISADADPQPCKAWRHAQRGWCE